MLIRSRRLEQSPYLEAYRGSTYTEVKRIDRGDVEACGLWNAGNEVPRMHVVHYVLVVLG